MNGLHIKTESLPTRCEICHHDDCFDASRNYCSRCAGAAPVDNNQPQPIIDENSQVPGIRQAISLGRDTKIENLVKTSLRWRGEIAPEASQSEAQTSIFSRIVLGSIITTIAFSLIFFAPHIGTGAAITIGAVLGFLISLPIGALAINFIPIIKNLLRKLQQFSLCNKDKHYKHRKHHRHNKDLKPR